MRCNPNEPCGKRSTLPLDQLNPTDLGGKEREKEREKRKKRVLEREALTFL